MKTGSTDRAGRNGSALGKWIAERPDVGFGLGEYCEGQLDKEFSLFDKNKWLSPSQRE